MTTPTTDLVAKLRTEVWHLRAKAPAAELSARRVEQKALAVAAADRIEALQARIATLEAALARARDGVAQIVGEALT